MMGNHAFVKADAASRGFHWEKILTNYFPDLRLNTDHQPCPACGGKDRFRFFKDWPETGASICNQCGYSDGIGLIMKTMNMSFGSVLRMLETEKTPSNVDLSCVIQARSEDPITQLRLLKQYVQKGLLLQSTHRNAAMQYLVNRGLGALISRDDLPDNLFYIANLQYKNAGERTQRFGCMFAAVHDVESSLVGGHRIYLSADGHKAPVSAPKKSLPAVFKGAMNGAAVRLYPATNSLCITEGIETALAVRIMRPQFPVWATLTAGGMKALRLPAEICDVQIFCDHDMSGTGLTAANTLTARLRREGRQVMVRSPQQHLPIGSYGDWLNVLCAGADVYE